MNILTFSFSPHFKNRKTVSSMMLDVIIALLPAVAAAVVFYKTRALLLILVCVMFAVLTEAIFYWLRKKPQSVSDYSSIITGILFSLTLPVTVPLWIAIAGVIFAVLVGKLLFGGLGYNLFNPALIGRAFIQISWLKELSIADIYAKLLIDSEPVNLKIILNDMLVSSYPVCLGDVSKICIIAGAAYLLYRKHISLNAPIAYITVFILASIIYGQHNYYFLLPGALVLGALFMATDPVTTPVSGLGKLYFGICCGIITFSVSSKLAYPQAVFFTILMANMFTPLIDKISRLKRY
ncbi:MAG: hypothetical protein A2252_07255 [Elusimicrobia bacterium RIFOXYA2_FULL_39_19]|nr:MAG: hypothetical protein A2252_07255 [Elusimicrobia bacterium RIFOXYA2_FULL_39_19]